MAPYVPRKKVNGQYLCPACAETPRGGYVSATALKNVSEKPEPFDPSGLVSDDTDGHFMDGIDSSGVHPLAAPLSPVIWENYRRRRALVGADPYPQRVYDEARGKIDPGKAKRRQMSRAELLAAFKERSQSRHAALTKQADAPQKVQNLVHPSALSDTGIFHHLKDFHGYAPEILHAHVDEGGNLYDFHDKSHQETNYAADPDHKGHPVMGKPHSHGANYAPEQGKPTLSTPHAENMNSHDLANHLSYVHESTPAESYEDMLNQHADEHQSGQNSWGTPLFDHDHAILNAQNPSDMGTEWLAKHLVKHHGYPQELVDDTKGDGTAAGILGLHKMHGDSHKSENWAMHPDHSGDHPHRRHPARALRHLQGPGGEVQRPGWGHPG
jgi:hypothetical protein